LLKKFKSPIVSTSANPSGHRPAQSADQILRYFGNGVDLILDGGPRRSRESSTVLDVSEDSPHCIREGAVPLNEIKKVIQDVDG
jgi:L-threonylcarbamoyladenylate synthase